MATISISFGAGLTVTKTFTAAMGKEIIEGHLQRLQQTARLYDDISMASTDLEKITWFLNNILKEPVRNNREFRALAMAEAARLAEEERLKDTGFG